MGFGLKDGDGRDFAGLVFFTLFIVFSDLESLSLVLVVSVVNFLRFGSGRSVLVAFFGGAL